MRKTVLFFKMCTAKCPKIFLCCKLEQIRKKISISFYFVFVTNRLLPSFFPPLYINTCVSPLYREDKFFFSVSASRESNLKALFFFFFTSLSTSLLHRCF